MRPIKECYQHKNKFQINGICANTLFIFLNMNKNHSGDIADMEFSIIIFTFWVLDRHYALCLRTFSLCNRPFFLPVSIYLIKAVHMKARGTKNKVR